MTATVFNEWNEMCLCNEVLHFPVGTQLNIISKGKNHFVVTDDGKLVTRVFSDNFVKHFTLHDVSTGKLAYAIAYGKRGDSDGPRFTSEEFDYIHEHYSEFLRPMRDVILFNDIFFMVEKEYLLPLAKYLNIKEE